MRRVKVIKGPMMHLSNEMKPAHSTLSEVLSQVMPSTILIWQKLGSGVPKQSKLFVKTSLSVRAFYVIKGTSAHPLRRRKYPEAFWTGVSFQA